MASMGMKNLTREEREARDAQIELEFLRYFQTAWNIGKRHDMTHMGVILILQKRLGMERYREFSERNTKLAYVERALLRQRDILDGIVAKRTALMAVQ